MDSSAGKGNRLKRIAGLDMLPIKPYQGWNLLQLDEALRRPELFRGDMDLYAAVRREAAKRGLVEEERDPFHLTDIDEPQLPPLMHLDPIERHNERMKREDKKRRLKELLMEAVGKKKASLGRLLRIAALGKDASLDRQIDLFLERSLERSAHMVPSKKTNTPPMWKRNMDYSPEEGSPYFGSVEEFMERFPGGIAEWRRWREKTREQRNRRHRIAALMPKDEAMRLLSEAHFVPEGGDDVAELGDSEPKIWSDDPKWKSIGEFLEAHRGRFGQDADDAALKAARDFVKYWKLTTRKPKGEK
jgi:hypothetical protein